jgi:hypothetical protein
MRAVKTVAIELDRTRNLRLDFNAARLFKQETGTSLLRGGFSDLDEETLLVLVWACLRHEDPGLTLEHVGAHLHFGNLVELEGSLSELFTDFLPQPKESADAEVSGAGKAKRKTATSS